MPSLPDMPDVEIDRLAGQTEATPTEVSLWDGEIGVRRSISGFRMRVLFEWNLDLHVAPGRGGVHSGGNRVEMLPHEPPR
jgi:hypothetical protein